MFLDCRTPALPVFDAVTKIRRNKVHGHLLPVVAMMSGMQENDREKYLAAGMDDCIGKPIDPATLANLLEIWLPYGGSPLNRGVYPDMDESAELLEEITGSDAD